MQSISVKNVEFRELTFSLGTEALKSSVYFITHLHSDTMVENVDSCGSVIPNILKRFPITAFLKFKSLKLNVTHFPFRKKEKCSLPPAQCSWGEEEMG